MTSYPLQAPVNPTHSNADESRWRWRSREALRTTLVGTDVPTTSMPSHNLTTLIVTKKQYTELRRVLQSSRLSYMEFKCENKSAPEILPWCSMTTSLMSCLTTGRAMSQCQKPSLLGSPGTQSRVGSPLTGALHVQIPLKGPFRRLQMLE